MKRQLSLLFLFICILFSFACDEGMDAFWREVHAPVEVTDLPEEVWQTIYLFSEAEYELGNYDQAEIDVLRARQKAFYNRYIDADGIPIVGNDATADYHFVSARQVMLIMTAKHPHFREKLRKGFYFVLVGGGAGPEMGHDGEYSFARSGEKSLHGVPVFQDFFRLNYFLPNGGSCHDIAIAPGSPLYERGSESYNKGIASFTSFCVARTVLGIRSYSMRVVVHEFTHALHLPWMHIYDPTLKGKIIAAIENAKEKGLWGLNETSNVALWHEWWAARIEDFYFEIGPKLTLKTVEEFIAYDPVTAELIMEWFEWAPMQEMFSAETIMNRSQ